MPDVLRKEQLIRNHLQHPLIQEIRGIGLMLAIILPDKSLTDQVVLKCKARGVLLFWLLYEDKAVRLTPPLTITDEEIAEGCATILEVLNELQ